MKSKLFLVGLALLFAVIAIGCNGGGTTQIASDELQIKYKIQQLCEAMSAKNWILAKSYCYPTSSAYAKIEEIENTMLSLPAGTTISVSTIIKSIEIVENDAMLVTRYDTEICYQGNYSTDMGNPGITELVKIGIDWYIISLSEIWGH